LQFYIYMYTKINTSNLFLFLLSSGKFSLRTGLWGWDVQDMQSVHKWRLGCQPYSPAALYPLPSRKIFWCSFPLEAESIPGPSAVGRITEIGRKKSNYLIGTRTRDLPACSIAPQPSTVPTKASLNCLASKGTGRTVKWAENQNFEFVPVIN
jgi:hypothetical protein